MKKNLFIASHPLIIDKISRMRDKKTPPTQFRRLTSQVSMLLGYEALQNLKLKNKIITTPLAKCKGSFLAKNLVYVGILRAGLAMIDGLTTLEPYAKIAHIGMYRDEKTARPIYYYSKFPQNLKNSFVILLDPMLATGGSTVAALDLLKKQGAKNIAFICIIASKAGIKFLHQYYPKVPIFAGAVDAKMNKNHYIFPGLGDAGDRIFAT